MSGEGSRELGEALGSMESFLCRQIADMERLLTPLVSPFGLRYDTTPILPERD